MKRYARIENKLVTDLVETDEELISQSPFVVIWADVTNITEVAIGWVATFFNGGWTYAPMTDEELRNRAKEKKATLLHAAFDTQLMSALQFKVDAGVATPEEQAAFLANRQFCIEVSNIEKQPGYPGTINWPVMPA
ncbi:Caudovirales tail fiber assembly protein [Pseudomonas sp. GM18]|uniref:tail fiber assembly protein n=1 Tax=Pseudomonas sp. GM18 TaxID=1144324 RepID=UPI0002724F43|nr:tail fiber assembly protein [Pseudomonas sp. GM18]EJM13056.1 Caudovirales tail fiber assembly protein [Pseudomonas sp. GM18]